MSYDLADLLAALKTAYETVTGIGPVLSYEPKAFQAFPTMYTLLDRSEWFQMGMGGGSRTPVYELSSVLVFPWQDEAEAESDMVAFVDAIPAAVHADMTLGGVLDDGSNCIVEDCEPEFIEANGVRYKALRFSVRAGPMMDVV